MGITWLIWMLNLRKKTDTEERTEPQVDDAESKVSEEAETRDQTEEQEKVENEAETENGTEYEEQLPPTIPIPVTIVAHTSPGEEVFVTGNLRQLGQWDTDLAIGLTTDKDSYPAWTGSFNAPEGKQFLLKFFKKHKETKAVVWDKHDDYAGTVSPNYHLKASWSG